MPSGTSQASENGHFYPLHIFRGSHRCGKARWFPLYHRPFYSGRFNPHENQCYDQECFRYAPLRIVYWKDAEQIIFNDKLLVLKSPRFHGYWLLRLSRRLVTWAELTHPRCIDLSKNVHPVYQTFSFAVILDPIPKSVDLLVNVIIPYKHSSTHSNENLWRTRSVSVALTGWFPFWVSFILKAFVLIRDLILNPYPHKLLCDNVYC